MFNSKRLRYNYRYLVLIGRSYRSLVIPVSCFLFLFCRFEEELSTLQELWKLSEYVSLSYIAYSKRFFQQVIYLYELNCIRYSHSI